MNKHFNTKKIWVKAIAISVCSLFLFNTIAWAYPDRMKLAVQSIFNPLAGVEVRDIGIIKYYSLCLAKNFEGFESIPGDVNAAISRENINIIMEFSRKDEEGFKELLHGENEYIIPCRINKILYYAYMTLDEDLEVSRITVFTKKEFARINGRGFIHHDERVSREEEDILHEQEYDTPLSIVHSARVNLQPVVQEIKDNALYFFARFGTNMDFLHEAREFMDKPGRVTIIPRGGLLNVRIGEKEHFFSVSIEKEHASNRYINIPRDTSDDITQTLIHELNAKCGLSHLINEQIDKVYEEWRESGQTLDLINKYPTLARVFRGMRFVDLREVEERDYSAKGERHEDEASPADVPDKTPRVLSKKLLALISGIVIPVFIAIQFIPEIPLANLLWFQVPHFMNHTTLKTIVGFMTFMTMGEFWGQLINLRAEPERNFHPDWKRDINWATIGMVFVLTGVLFSWLWPLMFSAWTSALPKFLVGVPDQLVSCIFSSLLIFPLHGLITGLKEKRFVGKRNLSVIKDILREKLMLFREVAIRSFPYWVIGLAAIFSLPLSRGLQLTLVGFMQPPFVIYMFYMVNKTADPDKPVKVKRWAKILLPVVVLYNLTCFPWHISLPTLLIGTLLYMPTFLFGFKKETGKLPRVISPDFVIMMGTAIGIIFTALQIYIPELPLGGFIPVGVIQKLLAHTDLRIFLGFVIFVPMGDIYGQLINLREKRNFEPSWKRDINWVTVLTAFLITAFSLSWFWPLTYSWWTGSLPSWLLGAADQVFTAPISITAIFLAHGVIKKLLSRDKDSKERLSIFRTVLREKSLELWKTLLLALPYWGIGLGIIFSLPLSIAARTVIVGILEPPFYFYMFYLTNKSPDQDKKLKMKTWAKFVLPAALAYNIFYFPCHISIPVLLIGAAVYMPTLIWGFKKVPVEGYPHQGPEQDGPTGPVTEHVVAHPDTRNFKPGGSPADYLAAVGRHEELQAAHVMSDYKEKVQPKVSDSTIRSDRKKLEERGHLKKGPYRYRKGHEYSLTEEGRERLKLIERYEAKAKTVTSGFSCAVIDLVLSLKNNEKVLLALDENLGKEGTERLVRTLLKDICNMQKDEKLKTILQNLVIIKGRGEKLADEVMEYTETGKDGIKVKMSNVIMITEDSNKEKCQGFEKEAIITYVDDSQIDMMGYYPLVEVTLFTLAKALHYRGVSKYDTDKLISLYRSVNAEKISEDQIMTLYIDKRVVTIILKPAEPFEYDELHHIYKTISTFLQAA